ncbi:MAG: GNAT family N-acetyltransferase [Oscillospiraceae bacterium]|nr:GNAT family N-acetyltransferase [Oscillospiraceae bacterium]
MTEIKLNNGYAMKHLSENYRAELLALCIRCEDYYKLHCGVFPADREVDEIFRDLPPGKDYSDKFVLGFFDPSVKLVGVLDVIRNYKAEGEWTIGLMLLDPAVRGIGLGRTVHSALINWAKGLGARSFRIGVIEENANGHEFWAAMGYVKIEAVSMMLAEKTHIVDVMILPFPE